MIDQVKKLVPLALRLMLSESKAERQSAIQKILPHLIDFMALIGETKPSLFSTFDSIRKVVLNMVCCSL